MCHPLGIAELLVFIRGRERVRRKEWKIWEKECDASTRIVRYTEFRTWNAARRNVYHIYVRSGEKSRELNADNRVCANVITRDRALCYFSASSSPRN